MTLIKRENFFPTWTNLFDDFLGKEMVEWPNRRSNFANYSVPSVNVKENENNFEVEMAAPGLQKADFKIDLNRNLLTISSEKKEETEVKESNSYTRKEFSYQSFSRSFTLPEIVDSEAISAKYDNGILTVTIPKKEIALRNNVKQIEIQ
ncbi:MAG: Hsp20/alpha crystallin family protein [Bacteroidales bacterium]|nr:Hsp20/alpha crystallin family protein [Bacteroidales bacterium]